MKGKKLHRRIGQLMRSWPGYWPLFLWIGTMPVSTGLYLWAGWAIQKPLSDEFFWFFFLISAWLTARLCYEYWFCGWAYLWLFRKSRMDHFYRHIRQIVRRLPFPSTDLAMFLEAWLRRKEKGFRDLGPAIRQRLNLRTSVLGYGVVFLYSLVPFTPKQLMIGLCRAARWESGLLVLAIGNVMRTGLALGGVFGAGQVVRWMGNLVAR